MCLKDPYKIMCIILSLPFSFLSRPVHHPYFSLLSSVLLFFVWKFPLIMPGSFCKDSTVFTRFRVFCSSFS